MSKPKSKSAPKTQPTAPVATAPESAPAPVADAAPIAPPVAEVPAGTEAPAADDSAAAAPAQTMPKGGLLPFRARNLGRIGQIIDQGTKLGGDVAKAAAAGAEWTKPAAGELGAKSAADYLTDMANAVKGLRGCLDRCPEDYAPVRKTVTATFAEGDKVRVASDRCAPNTKLGMLGITHDMVAKIQSTSQAHKGGEGYLCAFLDGQGNVVARHFIGGAGLIKVA